MEQECGIRQLLAAWQPPMQANPVGAPNGLYVLKDWITEAEERQIVEFVAKQGWSNDISSKRATQYYGFRYATNGQWKTDETLPNDWGVLKSFADRIEQEFPGVNIAQCLVNLYRKDTTIGAHRDRETPIVFGLSLVGDTNMIWTKMSDRSVKYEALIPARSLYIMCDDAAFDWMHEVPNRKRVNYPDPNNNNALTIKLNKPDWYVRASITYRHFIGGDRPDRPKE